MEMLHGLHQIGMLQKKETSIICGDTKIIIKKEEALS